MNTHNINFEDAIALGQLIATAIAGIAGLVLSFAVYRLASRQREDSWQQHFAGIHDSFWKDPDFKTVRSWLACPAAYKELGDVLAKRKNSASAASITALEYEHLEKLDKFLNLITRVIALDTGSNSHKRLLDALFFAYWLKRAIGRTADDTASREDLYWYVTTFYSAIASYAKFDSPKQ